ncbi:helix-turn-helix transcriptional regulator [Streptomyces sp. 4R-3d]|uniref:helix-turn-helix domain-containing protein n=1 Tax=Streptomyces sp. 4R-3d TaxID=2559605 RepID=UPI001071C4B2|nr:helix-turn-helix transcriptional regulator [Streptomyces sp. 4R-3d]TFI30194.1 XRE family transcriptional regulator [Streptomyces sp. 4R-3d]
MQEPDHPPWVLKDRHTVANRVRGCRLDRNLTQEALAQASGVDRSTLQRIESGNWEIKLSSLSRLAHALNVPIAALLDRPN